MWSTESGKFKYLQLDVYDATLFFIKIRCHLIFILRFNPLPTLGQCDVLYIWGSNVLSICNLQVTNLQHMEETELSICTLDILRLRAKLHTKTLFLCNLKPIWTFYNQLICFLTWILVDGPSCPPLRLALYAYGKNYVQMNHSRKQRKLVWKLYSPHSRKQHPYHY